MNTNALLIGILVVVVFIAGFAIGRPSSFEGMRMNGINGLKADTTTSPTKSTTATPSANTGTKIPASSLTDGQKKMLAAMGIDANSITVTPAMIACAEASLGASRVEAIKAGASPSFAEGVKLAACYK